MEAYEEGLGSKWAVVPVMMMMMMMICGNLPIMAAGEMAVHVHKVSEHSMPTWCKNPHNQQLLSIPGYVLFLITHICF